MTKTFHILTAILAVALCASCASTGTGATKPGYVKVLSSGAILVNGKSVTVDSVGPALRNNGFGPRSQINVHVPDDVSALIMKSVTISLTKSGFRRVLFIKPQRASADVGTPFMSGGQGTDRPTNVTQPLR